MKVIMTKGDDVIYQYGQSVKQYIGMSTEHIGVTHTDISKMTDDELDTYMDKWIKTQTTYDNLFIIDSGDKPFDVNDVDKYDIIPYIEVDIASIIDGKDVVYEFGKESDWKYSDFIGHIYDRISEKEDFETLTKEKMDILVGKHINDIPWYIKVNKSKRVEE